MVDILTYISIFSGGLLLLLLLLSILGGLDFDFDLGDTDVDSGGLGLFKSILTFLAVASWVGRVVILTSDNKIAAIAAAIVSGAIAVFLLSLILKALLKNQKYVYWNQDMAVGKTGKVYLKIPSDGSGLVNVSIDGSTKEIKAKTHGTEDITTGESVFIEDYQDGYLIVSKLK